jgi:hypothetical protein
MLKFIASVAVRVDMFEGHPCVSYHNLLTALAKRVMGVEDSAELEALLQNDKPHDKKDGKSGQKMARSSSAGSGLAEQELQGAQSERVGKDAFDAENDPNTWYANGITAAEYYAVVRVQEAVRAWLARMHAKRQLDENSSLFERPPKKYVAFADECEQGDGSLSANRVLPQSSPKARSTDESQ